MLEFFAEFGLFFHHRDKLSKIVGSMGLLSGVEASLDVEYIMSTGANISTEFWSMAGTHEGQEPFLEWMLLIANTSDAPHVHSASYGDVESSLDVTFMQRVNTEFQKAGVRGISILFASGDDGAGCNNNASAFEPNFPASSPFVTAVGGTEFGISSAHELGNFISSGGFSNVFEQPTWQSAAVSTFLTQPHHHLPPASFYNAKGRAYPDVSAASSGFWVVSNLVPLPGVAGTSCAAPTFSGVIALLNDARLSAGKPTLGFLNPLIYSSAHASPLTDIVDGCNAGCSEAAGFCAVQGWDPVTGMGVPNYVAMQTAWV